MIVMDMSIAMAFYFAARGQGYQVHHDGSRSPYTTPAKVFFSGLGADEQLGYYPAVRPSNFFKGVLSTRDGVETLKRRLECNYPRGSHLAILLLTL
jgi:asparagine synthetase B (glutamine-hydrolysing)